HADADHAREIERVAHVRAERNRQRRDLDGRQKRREETVATRATERTIDDGGGDLPAHAATLRGSTNCRPTMPAVGFAPAPARMFSTTMLMVCDAVSGIQIGARSGNTPICPRMSS